MARHRVREAELLVNGCVAPLQLLAAGGFVALAVLAAVAVANLDEPLYAWLAANAGPVDPFSVIGMFGLALVPSLFVAAWLFWRWSGLIRWSFGDGALRRPLWLRCRVETRELAVGEQSRAPWIGLPNGSPPLTRTGSAWAVSDDKRALSYPRAPDIAQLSALQCVARFIGSATPDKTDIFPVLLGLV